MLAVGLCAVLLVCSVIYFRPLPLSSCIPENGSLLLHSNTFGVQNGEPYIHSEAYDHITEDQKEKIMESAMSGDPVIALCGKVWTPGRDPKKFPVCPECKEVYESLMG